MPGLKDRTLMEAELELVRHQIATATPTYLGRALGALGITAGLTVSLRAVAETLEWVLAGKISPAPLSGRVIDPADLRALQLEAQWGEDVMDNPRLQADRSADRYELNELRGRAKGVYTTLEWVTCRDFETGPTPTEALADRDFASRPSRPRWV